MKKVYLVNYTFCPVSWPNEVGECLLPRSNLGTFLALFSKSAICEESLWSNLLVLSRKLAKQMSCEQREQLIVECVLPMKDLGSSF